MAPRAYRGFEPRQRGAFPLANARLDRQFSRNRGQMLDPAEAARLPFVGVTTDGVPIEGLFTLEGPGAPTNDIARAAQALLDHLGAEHRAALQLPIDSDGWRRWTNAYPAYEPYGVLLDELDRSGREAAMAVVSASMSHRGFDEARNVMRLNAALGELIDDYRDSLKEWMYWFSLFGSPTDGAPWGWQLMGHHLDLNCFVLADRVVMTPSFLGAEPACAEDGPWAGVTVLAEEEAAGLAFVRSLNEDQRADATLFASMRSVDLPEEWRHPMEGRMRVGAGRDNVVVPYEGVRAAELSEAQRCLLVELLEVYVGRLSPDHARYTLDGVARHLDSTHFAWIGGVGDDDPFYYKVHSPVVLVEFDHHPGVFLSNPEPEKFHPHTVVRTPNGNDYGRDLLAQHYRLQHAGRA